MDEYDLPYGQKGVDDRSQWGTGTREAEVRLHGWCKGGLRQQGNDGGGCATMRERVESPGMFQGSPLAACHHIRR